MRHLVRAGIALATMSTLFGGAVAAQAAPAATVTVKVNRLILEPAPAGHAGSIRIVVRNTGTVPFSGGITITEPVGGSLATIDGTSACGIGQASGNRQSFSCGFENDIAPGRTAVVTAGFQATAKPQSYAQVAAEVGTVEVDGVTAEFKALFRSTFGSLSKPRTYVQDQEGALAVTAGDVTLTRQPDGSFAGRVPVTVRNNGDAAHRELGTELTVPAGVSEWSDIDPSDVCVGAGELPVPPGGNGVGCSLYGGRLAEGQERSFAWILRAPAGTAPGLLGTGTTLVRFGSPGAEQDNGTNIDTFTITVAG